MAKCYTIYCDASGQANPGDVLCVTGLGSTASRWLKFEKRWDTLLEQHQIIPPFHMTDFANGAGQYANFKLEKGKRTDFLIGAIKVIKLSVNKCFSVSVAVDDLRRNQQEYELPGKINSEHPYIWCAVLLYKQVGKWLQQHPGTHDIIGVIFERGDLGQLAFPNRLRELYPQIEPPIFKDKSLAPLQAADLLAYEFRKGSASQSEGIPVRRSFSEMLRHLPHDRKHYTFQRLSRLCERAGFLKRTENDVRSLASRRKHQKTVSDIRYVRCS